MPARDDLGEWGEAFFTMTALSFCDRDRPYFRPHFLGEKAATFDFLVELVDADPKTPFFFVQVRTTRRGYTRRTPRRLRVSFTGEEVRRMALYPAPSYAVGVDQPGSLAYLVSIRGTMRAAIPSLPTTFPLNALNLARLWQEVKDYWGSRDMTQTASVFSI